MVLDAADKDVTYTISWLLNKEEREECYAVNRTPENDLEKSILFISFHFSEIWMARSLFSPLPAGVAPAEAGASQSDLRETNPRQQVKKGPTEICRDRGRKSTKDKSYRSNQLI